MINRLSEKKIRCKQSDICTSSKFYCNTCLRNEANDYTDNFSIKKGGHNPLDKWLSTISKSESNE